MPLNNQLIYEIAKYLDAYTEHRIINEALDSPEIRAYKMQHYKKYIGRWILKRKKLEDLKSLNIYREIKEIKQHADIHKLLENVFVSRCKDNDVFCHRISSRLAGLGRNVDFGLRKKTLKAKLSQLQH